MYSFELNYEETLHEFNILPDSVNGEPTPLCIINEIPHEGLLHERFIKNTQDWTVDFHWRIEGNTSDAMGPFDWKLSVFLLLLSGPGGVTWSQDKVVAYDMTGGGDDYINTMNFDAGLVPDGLYQLNTTVEVIHPNPLPVIPVAMFGNGPSIVFYTP